MIIKRTVTFSKKEKDKDLKKVKRLTYLNIGAGLAAIKLGNAINKEKELSEEEKRLINDLEKEVKSKDINYIKNDKGESTIVKYKKPKTKITKKKVNKQLTKRGIDPDKLKYGEFNIHTNSKTVNPTELAHELGHYDNITGKGIKNYVQKAKNVGKASKSIGSTTNLVLGIKNGRKEANGEKVNDKQKAIGMSATLASQAPIIASEINASRVGYEKLKKLGASPEVLSKSRGHLKACAGTYALGAARSVIGSDVSYHAGKAIGKNYEKLRSKRERNKNPITK